jgi:lauroyl/myristoyl acyltransferase
MYEILRRTPEIVAKIPYRLRLGLAVVTGSLAWVLSRTARRSVTSNVTRVFCQGVPRSLIQRIRIQKIVRQIFCSCAHNYLELFASLRPMDIITKFDVQNVEFLEEALSHGAGVILFSAHLGPFEYSSSWLSAHGYQTVIPVERLADQRTLQLMLDFRRRNGVDFVPVGGPKAARRLFKALQRNQIVLITADRAIGGGSIVTDFFGAPAKLPIGPVDLSVRTGAPLVGGFGWRAEGGRVQVEFTRLSLALPSEQRQDKILLQAVLTRQLERVIREHIDQWVVFDSIWDETRDAVEGLSKHRSAAR